MGEGFDMISEETAELFGIRSALDGGMVFCGVSEEQFAINGVTYQWPRGAQLTWGVDFTRLGPLTTEDVLATIGAALKEISDCCDVSHEFVERASAANIVITQRRLDGPSGVLADCQIPVGNVSVTRDQLTMRIDDSEAWGLFENPPAGKIDFYRVVLHELLHAHGLGHKPSNINEPALIAPMYSTRIRNLQAADKAELVRRYGPRKTPATPGVPPSMPSVPTDGKLHASVEVTIGEQVWVAAGPLKLKG